MLKLIEYIAVASAALLMISLCVLVIAYSFQPSNDQQPRPSRAETHARYANEEHTPFWQRVTRDPLAVFTLFLVLFTMVLAAVGVGQLKLYLRAETVAEKSADAAKESADVANRTLIASQRAWIRTDKIGFGGGGLAIDNNGASVSISFTITNTGNTPAINITPHAWLVVLKSGGPFPWQVQQSRCGEIRTQAFAPGFTLFPGESFPSNLGIDGWSLGTNASREELEAGAATSADKKQVVLYVVGCIDYTFPTDATTHHQTGFILEVRRDRAFPITLEDGVLPISRLSLMETGIGPGRYAD